MAAPTNPQHGEKRWNSKLTNKDIKLLFEIFDHREQLRKELSELSNRKLAEKFDVHRRTIENVSTRETWYRESMGVVNK